MSSTTPKPNNDFIAISISDLGEPKKYFCNLCNRSLVRMGKKTGEYLCTNCNISYFPNQGEKLKSQSKFDLPGPKIDSKGQILGDKMPLISMIEDSPNLRPGKSVFPRSLESLKRTGVTITDYHSTVDNEGL
jgi:hypothetical protein